MKNDRNKKRHKTLAASYLPTYIWRMQTEKGLFKRRKIHTLTNQLINESVATSLPVADANLIALSQLTHKPARMTKHDAKKKNSNNTLRFVIRKNNWHTSDEIAVKLNRVLLGEARMISRVACTHCTARPDGNGEVS